MVRRSRVQPTPVLEMRGITKAFPGIVANDHVDFELAARRGARAARRERRRQVDADEHPLRALQGRRGRDPAATASRSRSRSAKDAIDAGIGMVHQHFMLIPVMTVAENIVLGIEPTRDGIAARRARRRASACASSRSSSGSPSTRRARRRDHRRPAAARRDPEGALPRRRDPDPRRADGGADAAGGDRAVRDRQAACRRTASRSSSSATS